MARKRNGNGAQLVDALPSWVPADAWSGWLEVRAAKRAPNTERALALALAKLDRLRLAGEDVGKVIDQSTERGWTTFYPYRDTVAGGNGNGAPREVAARTSNRDAVERWLNGGAGTKH